MFNRLSVVLSLVAASVLMPSAKGASLLVEAESFNDKGGWVVDQQYIEIMGSPYLLAHGLGEPVNDAVTTAAFPATGTYKMWVRTKDWIPGSWTSPGRFEVLLDGTSVGTTFGTISGWTWQDGGTVHVTDTNVEIRLHDLTGFDGRCDAIYFDTNTSAVPLDFDVNNRETNRQWRNTLLGLPSTPPDGGEFDVVIVGGGISGCAAALAANQKGLSVALIQDRPLLGGNASSEIRVHTEGIHGEGGDILSQIDTAHWPNGSASAIGDQQNREAVMAAATHVTLFSSHRAYDVQMSGNSITSVDACSTITGAALRFRSNIFIDCTGDGWIGYWAGADYRYGRESKDEFDEEWATKGDLWSPAVPDNRVMGSSLLWNSLDTGSPSTFPAVPWAMDVAKTKSATAGEWYWEYSDNDKHQIDDAEEIRDHMFRAIYGSFYNAKKSGNANRKLLFVGYLNGKRESRRLMGDYIYTQSDAMSGTLFADAVVQETRSIDVHYQQILSNPNTVDFLSTALFRGVPRYYIPFRCLYSRNIDNLMMAGRDFSCSHIGLGGPRVMNTCGQMGIATGYAASLCKKYGTNPRGIYTSHIGELKGLVSHVNPLRPVWVVDPITDSVAVDRPYENSLANYATDQNGDPITYSLDGSSTWLTVATNGDLSGTPLVADLGLNTFSVIASDGISGSTTGTLEIVVGVALPAVWQEDPVSGADSYVGVVYNDSLAGKATDPNGEPIIYSLISAQGWLNVASNGVLSGTPLDTDAGLNTFTVGASDGIDGTTEATLKIFVSYEPLEIMNDGFDAANTFAGNGWNDSASVNWVLSTGGFGNPANYAWGGGDASSEDPSHDSGILSKDSGYAIQAGDRLTLKFDARDVGSVKNGIILAKLYYNNGAEAVELGRLELTDDEISPSNTWLENLGELVVDATPASVGHNLFVSFEGSGGNELSAQRLGFDNVVITRANVPSGPDPIGEITLGGLVGGDLIFSWDTTDGQSYNVLTNADLTNPSGWGILKTIVGDGSPVSVTNKPDQGQLFYKATSE